MKTHTSDQIGMAIKIANTMKAEREMGIMADMKTHLDTKGYLSDRQWDYLDSLMIKYTDDRLLEFKNFKRRFTEDEKYQERVSVVSDYYINNSGGYFSKTAFNAKVALGFVEKGLEIPSHRMPDYSTLDRMLNNKYSDKVWESHISPPLYSAGDLVQIRSTGVNRIWGQRKYTQERDAGIGNLNSHPCLIIKVNAEPITDALQYKPKQGGARVYKVMPIGSDLIYSILECDLKKNRVKKSKK